MTYTAYRCPYTPVHFKMCKYFKSHDIMPNRCKWLSENNYRYCINESRNINIGHKEPTIKILSWDDILKNK
jgi:hypothetical protein